MKKVFVFLQVFVLLFSVSALNLEKESRQPNESFDSIPMLDAFYQEQSRVGSSWDDVTVSILTVSKEDPVYSWFGHAAILVEDSQNASYMYDYGRFSFGSDFYANFAMGRLWYKCGESFAFGQLDMFKENKRSVTKTVLNLTNEQKKAVVDFLDANASQDYNTYLYHHYNDNCSTRLRDLINRITEGDFERWAKSQKGLTFRQETSRILHNNVLWQWLLDFLQSGNIDHENTLWEDMFLPCELSKALSEYNNPVIGEQSLLIDNRDLDSRPLDFEIPQSYIDFTLTIGIAAALIALILKKYFPKAYGVYSFAIIFILGLLGSLLFFMSFFTSHDVTWNNLNLLFINPLLLVMAFFHFRWDKNTRIIRIFYGILLSLILINITGKFVFPDLFIQQNWPQILTVLPLYVVFSLF